MSNNPLFGSLRMGQRRDQPQYGKHVCIFELARKGAVLTAEIVCMVCGVYLSAQQDRPAGKSKAAQGPQNQRNL